ncbi:cache domain-containing protein [Mycetohabitans sp. B46]
MPKPGYVIAIPQWNWMVSTGLYLDDVDCALRWMPDGCPWAPSLSAGPMYPTASPHDHATLPLRQQ